MNCICNELRKAARSVTSQYDRLLAPTGLRINQFAVLSTLSRQGSAPLTKLADSLALDQTTATRSILSLEQLGLIERIEHPDSRVKLLRLTGNGRKRLKSATAAWEQAQAQLLERVSIAEWTAALKTLRKLRTPE